jgi:hypothetical protein
MTGGMPTLAELLTTWQTWSTTNTLIGAIARAQTNGDTAAAEALGRRLPAQPEVDALTALAANHELICLLAGWQWHAIREAREHGATWTQIATVLGTTAEDVRAQYLDTIARAERYTGTDTAPYRAVLGDPESVASEGGRR